MFKGELAKIIEKLYGYDDEDWFEVLEAKKDGDCWKLLIKHRIEKQNKNEEAKDESSK